MCDHCASESHPTISRQRRAMARGPPILSRFALRIRTRHPPPGRTHPQCCTTCGHCTVLRRLLRSTGVNRVPPIRVFCITSSFAFHIDTKPGGWLSGGALDSAYRSVAATRINTFSPEKPKRRVSRSAFPLPGIIIMPLLELGWATPICERQTRLAQLL